MGALANAAALMKSQDFKDLAKAAAIYQATVVIANNAVSADDPSHQLAAEVLNNPQIVLDRLTAILAGTPSIATVSGVANQIPDDAILARTAEVWPYLAAIIFPPAV